LKIQNEVEIKCIRLSPFNQTDQNIGHLAFFDRNKDLFVVSFQRNNVTDIYYPLYKIGTQVNSMMWNETSGTMVCITESKIVLYHYPSAPFIDVDLLSEAQEVLDFEACEKAQIISFRGAQIIIRRGSGAISEMSLAQDPSLLFENAAARKWKECSRFCRFIETPQMWATLACLALNSDNLKIAEIALMAIKRVDKVDQIKYIRNISNKEVRNISFNVFYSFTISLIVMSDSMNKHKNAEMCLYKRNFDEAVAILLQSRPPLTYRAIKVLIHTSQWEKALQVALRSKEEDFINIILYYRARHLKQLAQVESKPGFQSLFQQRSVISEETLAQLKSKVRVADRS
jgi:hypothetical protein